MLARYFLRVALIFAAVLSSASAYAFNFSCSSTGYSGEGDSLLACAVAVTQARADVYGQTATSCSGVTSACLINSTCNLVCGTTANGAWMNAWYTFSGACAAPSVLQSDGSCLAPPPPPPSSECTVYPVSSYVASMSGAGNQPLQACMQNCLFDTGSGMSWGLAGDRQWASSGRSTGTYCATNTAAASSANDPACPAGQSLNASGVCAPLAMCPYDQTIYAINVNCHPALCPTDVSLYASSPLCSAPPASAVPVVVDCAITPSDPICSGVASGVAAIVTGTPGTSGVYASPTYSGGSGGGGVSGGGGGASGVGDYLTFDSVSDSVPLEDKSTKVEITVVPVGGDGSCPAPSVMVLHGHTYYFDWTTYCNFAILIKPVLLAFAWLAAAGILVGGFVA